MQPEQGCAPLSKAEESGSRWAPAPSPEVPGGHADPGVLCLHPTGCSKMWDNITCWPATPRGQVVILACPIIYQVFSHVQGKSPGLK